MHSQNALWSLINEIHRYKLADAAVLCARLYGSQADPIIATVPRMIFSSNSHMWCTSLVGTTAQTIAIAVTMPPMDALTRLPAFHALRKI